MDRSTVALLEEALQHRLVQIQGATNSTRFNNRQKYMSRIFAGGVKDHFQVME